MNMIFEQLWNGNIEPYKHCGESDPEIRELEELIERNRTSLVSTLTDKQQKLLRSYTACCDEYAYLMTVHAFREGFSLAVKLLQT